MDVHAGDGGPRRAAARKWAGRGGRGLKEWAWRWGGGGAWRRNQSDDIEASMLEIMVLFEHTAIRLACVRRLFWLCFLFLLPFGRRRGCWLAGRQDRDDKIGGGGGGS